MKFILNCEKGMENLGQTKVRRINNESRNRKFSSWLFIAKIGLTVIEVQLHLVQFTSSLSLPETALIPKLQATVLRKTIGENKKDLFPREILGSMEFTEAKIMTRMQIFMYLFRFKFTKIYRITVIWKNIQKIYLNSRYNIFKGWNINFPFFLNCIRRNIEFA